MNKKRILVIDGQGGKAGAKLIEVLSQRIPDCEVIAVGTNSIATATMLKAGARSAATGENAVIVNSRKADYIVGPVGIVIADSLLGEITPSMATAVGQSTAKKILLPFNCCDNIIVGVGELSINTLVQKAADAIICDIEA